MIYYVYLNKGKRDMIITFCGHARFVKTEECEQKIRSLLEEKVGASDAYFYLGGYGDFDRFAYDCCKKYKKATQMFPLHLLHHI